MNLRQKTVAFTIAVLAVLVHSTNAGQFTFEKIADVTPEPFLTTVTPSLNNNGVVAFFGSVQSSRSLFVGNGQGLSAVVNTSGGRSIWGVPVINDSDQVAFNFSPAPTQGGLHLADAGGVRPLIVQPYPPETFAGAIGQSLTNDATISFYTRSASDERIYELNDGHLTLIDAWGGGGFTILGRAEQTASSNNGAMAYMMQPDELTRKLIRYLGGEKTEVLSINRVLGGDVRGFSVNDSGTVAFSLTDYGAGLSPLASGLYLNDGANYMQLVGGSLFEFETVSLNNPGSVAFLAKFGTGIIAQGIFTGPDPLLDKVIQTGDLLNGNQVRRLVFGETGLNDHGQVAFYAEFVDGRAGQFVATPVPEASSFVLGASGAISLLLVAMRRRLKGPQGRG